MSSLPSSNPQIITAVDALRATLSQARRAGKSIGLVPTMGALHAGHLSLVDRAREECDLVVVTIFVNPTQFAPHEDFARYPRTPKDDCQLLGRHGADLVFMPNTEAMYGPQHATYVEAEGPAVPWEGEFRPGHFRGVATIVLKLFNLVQPDRAYFGRKDYQQTCVVRRMIADLDLPLELVVCPTLREPDGLAMSSRNRYLSADERRRGLSISASLTLARKLVADGTRDVESILERMIECLEEADLKLDYVAIVDPETLERLTEIDRPAVAIIAARVGDTRLIDNDILN